MSAAALVSPLLASLREPQTGIISPRRLAERLHMSVGELAEIAGLHRNSLSRSAGSPEVQARLGTIVQILRRAASMVGDDDNLAVYWFRNELLSGFDGKRAVDLVKAGQTEAVIAFLDMVEHGVPA